MHHFLRDDLNQEYTGAVWADLKQFIMLERCVMTDTWHVLKFKYY